jgi:hypothetical protein
MVMATIMAMVMGMAMDVMATAIFKLKKSPPLGKE